MLGWSSWSGRFGLLIRTLGDGDRTKDYKSGFGGIGSKVFVDEWSFLARRGGRQATKPQCAAKVVTLNMKSEKSAALMFGDGTEVLQTP
jgi:hypothetical protein